MSEWIAFEKWPDQCARLERPGIVFEVENKDGQRLLTACVPSLPVPPDWTSPPVRFRTVAASAPRHSDPLPPPRAPR